MLLIRHAVFGVDAPCSWYLLIPGFLYKILCKKNNKSAELVWVLQSFNRLDRSEIAPLLNAILHARGIEVGDKLIVSEAIALYREGTLDFIDAWIVSFAKAVDVKSVYTFDRKHFKGIAGMEMLHP